LNNRSITNKKSRNKQKTGQADRIIRPVLSAFERADLRDARSLKHLYFKNFAGIIKTLPPIRVFLCSRFIHRIFGTVLFVSYSAFSAFLSGGGKIR
jgi:hypothetical protein